MPDLLAKAMERHRQGDAAGALPLYRAALREHPHDALACHYLGLALAQEGDLAGGIAQMERSVALDPGIAQFDGNLGEAYRRAGRMVDAVAAYRRLVAALPSAEARAALVEVLLESGDRAAALETLAALDPAAVSAPRCRSIGALLHEAGLAGPALDWLDHYLARVPNDAEALNRAGGALADLGRHEAATVRYRAAITADPAVPGPRNNLGLALAAAGRLTEAIAVFQALAALRPDYPKALCNLGGTLLQAGRTPEAEAVLDRALAVDGRYARAIHNRLLAMQYSTSNPAALAAAHRRLGALLGSPADSGRPLPRPPAGGRLRVGLVSGDLRRHPVGYFVDAFLPFLDRRRLAIHTYSTARGSDPLGERLRRLCDGWTDCAGLADERLAAAIADDRIELLVDLAGHTEGNRLPLFARRAAPVQIAFLGYPTTTGVPAIDFRITDRHCDPPGYERHSTERLLRLPESYYVYAPRPEAPPVSPLPALRRGAPTFGACLHYAKLSDTTLSLWCAVLRAVPDARLVLRSKAFADGTVRDAALARFVGAGIAAGRITLYGPQAFPAHLSTYDEIDIGLDTFPFNLATNLVEALWQGVPVVSRYGETSASRMGLSLLSAAGLAELATADADEFVDLCRRLAADLEALSRLRQGLRDRLSASALFDGRAYARALGELFEHAAAGDA